MAVEGGAQQAVIVMRQAVLQLCAAQVQLGKLVMFSDYGVVDSDLGKELIAVDEELEAVTAKLDGLQHRWRDTVKESAPDRWGGSKP